MLATCKICGATMTIEGSFHRTNIRCSVCGAENKLADDSCGIIGLENTFECEECGLKCLPELKKCPACGGNVISVDTSIQQLSPAERKCATNGHVEIDAFLENWEKNLGGYSFSVVIGLTSTIFFTVIFDLSILKEGVFEAMPVNFFWCAIAFEFIVNAIFCLIAFVLLALFFRRSRCIPSALSSYFKWCGVVKLVDLLLVLFAAETESLIVPDIKEFGAAMGCFFWSWYFKRLFAPLTKNQQKNCQ